ncbi:MAG: DUF4160 domain-containing protein [Bacteroidales bacterium]|nr:DUF4160 domain-containing protein [Bacteroidales bacterium]
MPKIFEYFGLVFFFYSNEHEPIHVHVMHGACQLIFELIYEDGELKKLRQRPAKGYPVLNTGEAKTAEDFIKAYASQVVGKWVDYFIMKKKVVCTEIKTRI